jgi:nitrogen-specific signal transduction histidine kinase/ActR/RegA family two-component response regulator
MVGGLRDLTQEQALKEQIARSLRLESIGQLTGGIAHDFNNLLTVILGNSELLGEILEGKGKPQHLAQMIQSAAQRGAELTSRLLAFARRQDLEPEPTDIRNLVNQMRPLLRRTVPANVSINLIHASDLWLADIDPGQLESALLNLALNARDAMAEGGSLLIETANFELDETLVTAFCEISAGQYVQIAVTDNGEGIEKKNLGRLFEPFFTTKSTDKGTGLGLAMVYGFIKQSKGHIKVYSEPGEGTTIRMYLPRSGADSASTTAAFESDEMLPGTERVLVVEDDDLVLQHARRVLQMLGYQVEVARNEDQALGLLAGPDRFDLLFTDVIMPGSLKGPELAVEARRLQPGLRVLYTSGYTDNAVFERGQLDSTVHLLQKPYRRTDLARKMREAIDSD